MEKTGITWPKRIQKTDRRTGLWEGTLRGVDVTVGVAADSPIGRKGTGCYEFLGSRSSVAVFPCAEISVGSTEFAESREDAINNPLGKLRIKNKIQPENRRHIRIL